MKMAHSKMYRLIRLKLMLQNLKKELQSLEQTSLEIVAKGSYPKRGTKVSLVAMYQNDGTATIKASHFVERAGKSTQWWKKHVYRAIDKWLDGDHSEMSRAGKIIAHDIARWCDRIDTGRLRQSFIHRIY